MRERLKLPTDRGGMVWRFANPGHTFAAHTHSELELNLVLRGQARYLVDDRRYDLRPGTMVWLFPRQNHVLLDQSPDYRMWIAVFKPGLLRRVCTSPASNILRQLNPAGDFCRQLEEPSSRKLIAMLEEMSEGVTTPDPALFDAQLSYLLLLAWEVHRHVTQNPIGRGVHPAVEKAARLIRDDRDRMKIDELADQCGLSPSRLSRLFKQQTGVPLVRYRARVAIDRFLQIYAADHDRKTMLQAALEAGFGSYAQFHRVFKEVMGAGPAKYRM